MFASSQQGDVILFLLMLAVLVGTTVVWMVYSLGYRLVYGKWPTLGK